MKLQLKTFEEEIALVVDGQSFVETIEGGRVVQSCPRLIELDGVFVENLSGSDEKIQLFLATGETYLWSAPLADYDPSVSDDPDEEPRWVLS